MALFFQLMRAAAFFGTSLILLASDRKVTAHEHDGKLKRLISLLSTIGPFAAMAYRVFLDRQVKRLSCNFSCSGGNCFTGHRKIEFMNFAGLVSGHGVR
jgi:hypothetical protein